MTLSEYVTVQNQLVKDDKIHRSTPTYLLQLIHDVFGRVKLKLYFLYPYYGDL